MNLRVPPVVEKAPYVAASSTGVALYTLNEWAIIIGLAVTVATFIINWVYKFRRDRRERIEHELAISGALDRRKALQTKEEAE
ncbi:MAG: phage holin family protein [Planctomycetota bacterium]|jgi:Flp pilus assembly protein TadB|nr:phage holin family protein [Planctomycetota bacterium]